MHCASSINIPALSEEHSDNTADILYLADATYNQDYLLVNAPPFSGLPLTQDLF